MVNINKYHGSFYKGKNVLLFGGFGLIGTYLAKQFYQIGSNVTIVSNKKYDKNLVEKYKYCQVVFEDPLVHFNYFKRHIINSDIILNLIQGDLHDVTLHHNITNLNFEILNFCKERNMNPILVHMGSRLQYSNDEKLPLSEKSKIKPLNIYSFEKQSSENHFLFFNKIFGLNTICLRISNIYGYREHFSNNIVDTLIRSCLAGEIIIDKNKNKYKDFLYIEDFIHILLLCIKNKRCYGNVFNVGSGKKISLSYAARAIKDIFNPHSNIKTINSTNKEDFSFYLDINKIKKFTNWCPLIPFKEGLEYIKKEMRNLK